MKLILYIIAMFLVLDVVGFIAWRLTDQTPYDDFHAGIITETILSKI